MRVISSGSLLSEDSDLLEANKENQLMVLPTEFSEPFGVMSKARSDLLMGNYLGMRYDFTDETLLIYFFLYGFLRG